MASPQGYHSYFSKYKTLFRAQQHLKVIFIMLLVLFLPIASECKVMRHLANLQVSSNETNHCNSNKQHTHMRHTKESDPTVTNCTSDVGIMWFGGIEKVFSYSLGQAYLKWASAQFIPLSNISWEVQITRIAYYKVFYAPSPFNASNANELVHTSYNTTNSTEILIEGLHGNQNYDFIIVAVTSTG
jgi:hypothetical protein